MTPLKTPIAVWATTALALALSACSGGERPVFDTKAPALVGTEILSGKPDSLSHYDGKVRLVVFWATWCPPCLMEIPTLVQLQAELADSGFQVVGVNMDEERDQGFPAKVRFLGITYPVLAGGNKEAADWGEVTSLPTSFLVDRSNNIREQFVGLVPHGLLREKVINALRAPANGNQAAGEAKSSP